MSTINNKPNFPPPLPSNNQGPAVAPRAEPGSDPSLQAQLQAQLERLRTGSGGSGTTEVRKQEKLAEQTQVPTQRTRSASEIEQLAGQVGYVRPQKKKRHGFELDDMSQAPIPLPSDDIDDKNGFDQKSLDDAQEGLTLQGNELKELTREMEQGAMQPMGFVSKLVGRAFKPTPQDIERLEALKERTGDNTPEVGMTAVNGSLEGLFGINIAKVPQGPAMVAAALVVAGMSDAVQPRGDSLDSGSFCKGMQTVVSNGNEAVDDARTMSSGINRQLAMQRTFVFRK